MRNYLTPFHIIKEIYTLSKHIINFLERNNYLYFVTSGTLIGVAKYNFILPWEVDFDIALLDRSLIYDKFFLRLLRKLDLKIIKSRANEVYRLVKINNTIDNKNNLPSIDLIIYNINKNGIFCTPRYCDKKIPNNSKWQTNRLEFPNIFPLKYKKLGDFSVKVPNNYKYLLEKMYKDYEKQIKFIGYYDDEKKTFIFFLMKL